MPIDSNDSSNNADLSVFASIRKRADDVGIANVEEPFANGTMLSLEIPNGRKTRAVRVFERGSADFAAVDFESMRFLGDYAALQDSSTGRIEARLTSLARPGSLSFQVRRLPGIEEIDAPGEEADLRDDDFDGVSFSGTNWRLRVEAAGIWIELSPASDTFSALERTGPQLITLKINAPANSTHDESLALLERLAHSFFFDLDLRYGVSLDLGKVRTQKRNPRRAALPEPPQFPQNHYLEEPLSLYRYGRSASELPLLEFLAYYQSLEYFFPYFSSDLVIRGLRAEIQDPRFDSFNDQAIGRLIQIARPSARAAFSEREQLRATVAACVDIEIIRDFVLRDETTKDHFCSNKQPIQGVKKIQLNDTVDLQNQIADRIYEIRCRVVHAKQDGSDSGVDLLLPSSAEATSLSPDIELVRTIAQRAIILRSTRMASEHIMG